MFLGAACDPVPALPAREANHLLDDLLSAPASPPMFDALPPAPPLSPPDSCFSGSTSTSAAGSPMACAAPEPVVELFPPPALSPDPLIPPQVSTGPADPASGQYWTR